jgi:CHAD domain-containing protein
MTTLPESERAPVGSEEAAAGPESELVRRILAKTDEAEAALRALLAPDAGPDVAALSAAKRAERDRELVHDYRVALRRLRSILRLVAPAFGKKKVRKLVDAIREAGALTGDLRDEEVLRETLTELKPASSGEVHLERWMFGRARRERGQRSRVVKVIRAHGDRGEGVARALANVRARLSRPPRRPLSDRELATQGLASAYGRVSERARADGVAAGHKEAMHKLRIAFKQLRYTCETITGLILPSGWEQRATEVAARLQKHLGKLHDLDEALVRMDRARGLDVDARQRVLSELHKRRRKAADKCHREIEEACSLLAALLALPLSADLATP